MAKYIDYCILMDFYTIQEACDLFVMSKGELRKKCEQYDVYPRKNEKGEWGFPVHDIRRLHNKMYYEGRADREHENPWV